MGSWLCTVVMAVMAQAPVEEPEYTLTAERVLHEQKPERTTAEGTASLSGNGMAINADRVTYDAKAQRITAAGNVVARVAQGGLVGITADVAVFQLVEGELSEVWLHEGEAIARTDVNRQVFLDASTAAALARAGKPEVLLRGKHLKREGTVWRVEEIFLVPCDCNVAAPGWSIRSGLGFIDLDNKYASVFFPWIFIRQVLVPIPIPYLGIPLSDRQTGLLMPRFNTVGPSGFGIEQPLFITLGRSADVTLTPGFFLGATTYDAATDTWVPTRLGQAGPRLGVEFRYAPSPNIRGQVSTALVYDLRRPRDPFNDALTEAGARGLRGEAGWLHVHDFGRGFTARVDSQVHSDGYYLRDGVVDVLARADGALRSTARLMQKGEDHVIFVDVALRQDLQGGYDLFGRTPKIAGSYAPALPPSTLHRLPAITLSLPVRQLVGPLAFDLEASAVRLAPLGSRTGDEGVAANEGRDRDALTGRELSVDCLRERLYLPIAPTLVSGCGLDFSTDKLGMADGVFQRGEREPRVRFDVLPRLWLNTQPAQAVSLVASAGWRQQAWFGETTGDLGQRGYPLVGARLATELRRDFKGGVRHQVLAKIEARAVPFVVGSTPAPYDELDRAIIDANPRAQSTVELSQRLVGAGAELLRLDVGQGFDLLGTQKIAETYGRFRFSLGPLSGTVAGRSDLTRLLLTSLSFEASLTFTRVSFWTNYENLLDDGSNRTRQPIDLLFGDRVPTGVFTRGQRLMAGTRLNFGVIGFAYSAMMMGLRHEMGSPAAPLTFQQHNLTVSAAPSCECWRVDLTATQTFAVTEAARGSLPVPAAWGLATGPFVSFSLGFTVSKFGSFGVAR